MRVDRIYYWVEWVGSFRGWKGGIELQLNYDADVPVVSSSLWWQKGYRVGVYELHYFVDALVDLLW